MQYEDFDNKVRDAADHYHPAYDEKAWGKMEKLLDTHLPEKKDNRRRFILFLLLIVVLGGAGFLITRPRDNTTSIAKQKQPVGVTPAENTFPGQPVTVDKKDEEVSRKSEPAISYSSSSPVSNTTAAATSQKNPTANPVFTALTGPADDNQSSGIIQDKAKTGIIPDNKQDKNFIAPGEKKPGNASLNENVIAENSKKNNTTPVADNTKSAITETVNKNEPAVAKNTEAKKNEKPGKKSNSFFFTVSGGPDVSATGSERPGKTKLLAGLGIGYTFKDRLTVRSGFYSGRKIYTASPGDYNPPADFWTYYPNLEKVQADCKVFEIPVTVSYQFGNTTKQNWFASAGLSSYLMKKETYDYFYKYTPTGPTINSKRTINNEYSHLFSVLALSGGYQRKINNTISIAAEPYVKLPLSGVGYGKVKLNSAGILFSLNIKPFQKIKKEK